MAISERLARASTQWDAACALLRVWRDELPEAPAREAHDARWGEWADLAHDVVRWFDTPVRESGDLIAADRERLVSFVLESPLGIDAVDAVAWGLDLVGSVTFASDWRDQVCPRGELTHELAEGELYPVAEPGWGVLTDAALPSRPASLTPPARDELPHVRVHRGGGFRIVASFEFERELEEIGTRLTAVAALHPHDSIDQFEFVESVPRIVFPVRLHEPDPRRVLDVVRRALEDGARILVLPELSTDPETIDAIAELLEDSEDQRLVVAGSYHEAGTRRNVAVGLLPDSAERLRHHKLVPFADDLGRAQPWREGIAAGDTITVHHADRFRFCLLTCKDFLSADVRNAMDRVGANVLCVPAMSEKTNAFDARARGHVADAQAVSVIANGPLCWHGGRVVEPAAVFGQPVRGHEAVLGAGEAARPAPSFSLLKVGETVADTRR